MRVQHNIAAMNSYRNYNNNTKSINKNLEKLSSGYKINRAGDDAAGLAISEKMRAQITGLEGAQKNAKDGISLVQTAEGALTEVHSMLNRMYSLAEQSANGTYSNTVDREQLQKEVVQLRTEIDRIADSSNFNGLLLLNGSQEARSANGAELGADVCKIMDNSVIAGLTFTEKAGITGIQDANGKKAVQNAVADALSGVKIGVKYSKGAAVDAGAAIGATGTITLSKAGLTAVQGAGGSNIDLQLNDDFFLRFGDDGKISVYGATNGAIDTNTQYLESAVVKTQAKTKFAYGTIDSSDNALKDIEAEIFLYGKNDGMQLQIGDTADAFNQMKVSIDSVHTSALGLSGCTGQENSVAVVDISSVTGATDAMAVLKAAINTVSDIRGSLGATQNRLEHTINNLSVMQENIQDAESTIRDTDVADEMMKYTKNSILVQSAQAMLAQANQQPQGVLQLLQ